MDSFSAIDADRLAQVTGGQTVPKCPTELDEQHAAIVEGVRDDLQQGREIKPDFSGADLNAFAQRHPRVGAAMQALKACMAR